MPISQHYISSDGRPLVLRSYCVFADLLGFTQRIRGCKTREQTAALCNQVFGLFEGVSEDLGTPFNSAENSLTYQFVSDGVILGAPTDDADADADLGFPVLDIACAQLRLVLAGFPIRGGLTYGDLHISERLVFGPTFLEAYDLERTVAKFPRIVVSREVLAHAARHIRYWDRPSSSPHTSLFWKGSDGHVFVNYLDWVNEGEGGTDWDAIGKHRDVIAASLKEFGDNERVRRKFVWMRDYHNHFCRNHWRVENRDSIPSASFVRSMCVMPDARPRHSFTRWGLRPAG